MNIGIKIKGLRLKNNMTQEDLSDRCGLTKGYTKSARELFDKPVRDIDYLFVFQFLWNRRVGEL